MNLAAESGFSLIEAIIVTVILLIASVPILSQFTRIATGTVIAEEIQIASQLAQERAEGVLAIRRNQGFKAVLPGKTDDVLSGAFSLYSRSLVVTNASSSPDCFPGAECKNVAVTVRLGTATRADFSIVLVDY